MDFVQLLFVLTIKYCIEVSIRVAQYIVIVLLSRYEYVQYEYHMLKI